MKKILIVWAAALLLASCGAEIEENTASVTTNTVTNAVATWEARDQEIISLQPEYKAELYGKVKSVEGNMFTISEIDRSKDPTIDMEQTEKKAYMASLSDADKIALKEMIANSISWETKVMIPVWIPMVKKEQIWEDKQDIEATLEDLKWGDIVSIWYNEEITDRKIAKYVKRSIRK